MPPSILASLSSSLALLACLQFMKSVMRSVGNDLDGRHVELVKLKRDLDKMRLEQSVAQNELEAANTEKQKWGAAKKQAEELVEKRHKLEVVKLKIPSGCLVELMTVMKDDLQPKAGAARKVKEDIEVRDQLDR